MASEWREARLAELGRIVTGKTPSTAMPGLFGGGVPFVTPTDFDGRRVIRETGRHLTHAGLVTVARARIPRGAVMVSCIGSDMGKTALAGGECVTNQQINSLIVERDADPLFIFYSLFGRRKELRSLAAGSAQPILNKSEFAQLAVVLPPLPEQRAIAHILGTLDDKIELNRRMSETLEAMARALFKSWFIDFAPVRAKAEGRAPGLPKPLADLFPSRLVDSELGEIPDGWAVASLTDAMQITDGRTLAADAQDRSGRFSVFGANGAIARAAEAWVDSPCIVLGKIGTCGALHRAPSPCWVTNNAFAIRAGYSRSLEFAWHTLKSIDFSNYIGGSANPYMPLKNFGHHQVVLPPLALLERFEAVAAGLRNRIDSADVMSSSLTVLRDALLPKLLLGDLRIEDAERFIGRIA